MTPSPSADSSPDLKPFTGQHALVTGGARGIGAAISEHLAARGAAVTLLGRSAAPLEEHKARLVSRYAVPVTAVSATTGAAIRLETRMPTPPARITARSPAIAHARATLFTISVPYAGPSES